jgi:hypothetical protein
VVFWISFSVPDLLLVKFNFLGHFLCATHYGFNESSQLFPIPLPLSDILIDHLLYIGSQEKLIQEKKASYGLFHFLKSHYRPSVGVFTLSRYRAGGLLVRRDHTQLKARIYGKHCTLLLAPKPLTPARCTPYCAADSIEEKMMELQQRKRVDPTPCTLHPQLYTLHPAPSIIHPAPCTLHPTPYTLHPAPSIIHPAPYTLNYTLHPAPCTLNYTPYTLHPQLYTLHPTPYTLSPKP